MMNRFVLWISIGIILIIEDGAFLIGFNITRLLDVQEEDMGEMMFKRKHK